MHMDRDQLDNTGSSSGFKPPAQARWFGGKGRFSGSLSSSISTNGGEASPFGRRVQTLSLLPRFSSWNCNPVRLERPSPEKRGFIAAAVTRASVFVPLFQPLLLPVVVVSRLARPHTAGECLLANRMVPRKQGKSSLEVPHEVASASSDPCLLVFSTSARMPFFHDFGS
jgi:hypothetical protein